MPLIQTRDSTQLRQDLPHFTVPTLVIHDTADKTVPIEATGRVVADKVPGVQFVEYPGEPQAVFATQTQRLCDDLLSLLSGEEVDNRQDVLDAQTAAMLVTQP